MDKRLQARLRRWHRAWLTQRQDGSELGPLDGRELGPLNGREPGRTDGNSLGVELGCDNGLELGLVPGWAEGTPDADRH